MYIQKRLIRQKKLHDAGYRLRFSLQDGEEVNVGGYRIFRQGKKICTDRSALYTAISPVSYRVCNTGLADGFNLEVYVDQNLIEVFVNEGEAVISNAVYQLGNEIKVQGNVSVSIETLE
mgnify:CR=1 FL=1